MDRQTITVDIAPEGYADHRLKVSQYDVGRPLGVYIKQDGADLGCAGYTAQLYLYKPDRTNIEKPCTISNNLITWDTAEQETIVAGICVAEIRIREGSRNVGTANFTIWVEESPADTSGSSHSESQSLIDMVDRAEDAAETAESSVAIAVHAKDETVAAAETVERFDQMTAEAETLAPGSEATAEMDYSGEHPVMKFGIPAGATGPEGRQGQQGQQGIPGVSPVISVSDITGGHRVTITDAEGTHTFDVMDGGKGDPGQTGQTGPAGYSPTVTVTDITGGHRVTITDQQGQHPFDVMDGEDSAVLSVNGETGAVVLDGTKVNVNNSASDPETIEEALGDVNRALTNLDDDVSDLQDLVLVQDEEPTEEGNMIWIEDAPTNYVVPSYDEFCALSDRVASSITDVASGEIANIKDGADNAPIEHLKVFLEPVQSGSGDPSPENVRPITGWTGVTVNGSAGNYIELADKKEDYVLNFDSGDEELAYGGFVTDYIEVNEGDVIKYTFTSQSTYKKRGFITYNQFKDKVSLANYKRDTAVGTTETITATIGEGVKYIRISGFNNDTNKECINENTKWQKTCSWEDETGDVYQGFVDIVTGQVVATHKLLTLNGTDADGAWYRYTRNESVDWMILLNNNITRQTGSYPITSNYLINSTSSTTQWSGVTDTDGRLDIYPPKDLFPNVQSWKSYLSEHNLQVVVRIVDTVVAQLDPQEIKTYIGGNSIYSQDHNIEVVYPCDTKKYIKRQIESL